MQNNINANEVKQFLDKLTEDKNLLYVIQPYGIGDFIYSAGLSYAVQKKKNKEATVFILQERMKNLSLEYPNVVKIIYLSKEVMELVRNYIVSFSYYETSNYNYGHFRISNGKMIWDDTLNFVERYKNNIFSLPLDTELIPPIVKSLAPENISALEKKYVLDKEKTMIIMPYANSMKNFDEKFWEYMVESFKKKNYFVYTNVDGISETPIKGTEPIITNFCELFFLSDKVKCFIGLRSGVFDFLSMTNAKFFTIDNLPNWHYNLSVLRPGCNNRTLYSAIDYIQPIANYLKMGGMNATIKFSHPSISTENIFYSYEDIMGEILRDVEKI